jgi:hypothetical protein
MRHQKRRASIIENETFVASFHIKKTSMYIIFPMTPFTTGKAGGEKERDSQRRKALAQKKQDDSPREPKRFYIFIRVLSEKGLHRKLKAKGRSEDGDT